MTKSDLLRRFCLPCCTSSTATLSATTKTSAVTGSKKRISTSLRDDIPDSSELPETDDQDPEEDFSTADEYESSRSSLPSRPSRTMVIGTIFGTRRGHLWFCIQYDRFNTRPTLLLELSIPISLIVKEMRCGIVRIALECTRGELNSCPLHSVPVWTMCCNGRKVGFAVRRKASQENRVMLKIMQNTTVGAGVIPSGSGEEDGEIMYMRANYECLVGSSDLEYFHLINPDGCPNQELSVFLMRSS